MKRLLGVLFSLALIGASVPASAQMSTGAGGWSPRSRGGGGGGGGGLALAGVGAQYQNCGFPNNCSFTGFNITAGELVVFVSTVNQSTPAQAASVAVSGCQTLSLTKIQDNGSGTNPASMWHGTATAGSACSIDVTMASGGTIQNSVVVLGTITGTLVSTTPTDKCSTFTPASPGQTSPYTACANGAGSGITIPSSGIGIMFAADDANAALSPNGSTFGLDSPQANGPAQSGAIGHNTTAGAVTPAWNGFNFASFTNMAAAWQ